ncbi:MAG TPA: type ISP restriction/modification enzyme, partial [Phycisphaerae bacterium]|nr:type ISP restriction/modification enzyme [Phycisphaerae bacterium]
KVLVVLGNPPYNAFDGVSRQEEQGLVEPYKKGLNTPVAQGGWGIKKFNLDDLYVRFFRLAERRIAEMTGRGVVSFISNFSYLSDPSFVVMRQRFLSEFDRLWFDCMNGDSRETGKLTPDGKPDPSVFSTEHNREGIRVGTAICVMVRKEKREKKPVVFFRHFWGVTKRQDLLASLKTADTPDSPTPAKPCKENRHSFHPENVSAAFSAWPQLDKLCDFAPTLGILDNRQEAMISIDKDRLLERAAKYLDPKATWEELETVIPELVRDYARFNARQARAKIIGAEPFRPENVRRLFMRPMDNRWCYYTGVRPIWTETRPTYVQQCWPGNSALVSRRKGSAVPEGPPYFFTSAVGMQHAMHTDAYYIPLRLAPAGSRNGKQGTMFKAEPKANLSPAARAYLAALGIKDPDTNANVAGLIWLHALAVGYSPANLAENTDGIRRDWPRVPLPDSRKALEASAELGRQVAALLDTEKSEMEKMLDFLVLAVKVGAVSPGKVELLPPRPEKIDPLLRTVGVLARAGGGALDEGADDLAVTAGWGHAGKDGVTMPAKGRIVERPYDADEKDAIAEAAKARGLTAKQALALLGQDTRDVYLNGRAYWKNIPAGVWEYYIGGYQVIKKWLSYRERELLGRALRSEEAREVTGMARRLAALVLLQPALDDNYRRVKASAYAWPGAATTA